MPHPHHRPLLTALLLLAIVPTTASARSDYPNKPVRFISDSASGSSPDVGLRIVAETHCQHAPFAIHV